MATASRDTAVLNSLYTSTIEKWMGGGRVEEIIFNANQLVWLMSKVAKDVGQYGFNMIQPLMTTRNTGVGWFEYDDPLSIDSMPGPEAAKYDLSFLGGPLVITEQEEIENSEPHRMVNILKFKYDQLMLSMAEEINTTGFRGSSVNSKAIDGLLDIFYPDDAIATLSAAQVVAARTSWDAGSNTYAGIARSTSTPTGWENYAIEGDSGSTADLRITSFTSTGYKALERGYYYTSRGSIKPDLIISGLQPYIDAHQLMAGTSTLYRREMDSFRNVQLGSDNIKFRNATWLYDEACTGYGVGGASASADCLFMFNSHYMKLCVEQGYDFVLTKFQSPVDGRVSIAHVLWRGQMLSTNPRYGLVWFDY